MLKVTIKFTVYWVILLCCSCTGGKKGPSEQEILHQADSVSESRIDSAYAAINKECDTLMVYRVPEMVDSLIKDPASPRSFFDTLHLFTDADIKVEKVIRQLKADCDSSLLKETYRRARLRQRSKPVRHTKEKA